MTSLNPSRSRRPPAPVLVLLLPLVLTLSPALRASAGTAWAADGDAPGATDTPPPSGPAGSDTSGAGQPPAETQAKPQLQIQDEGPSLERKNSARLRLSTSEETEERPYWKSWVFWTVTGALALGAVAVLAYTQSGTSSGVAPCPVDVAVSLGCFGAGR